MLSLVLYCIYFDYKRRHDPGFRRLLRRIGRQHKHKEARLQMAKYAKLIDIRISELELDVQSKIAPAENSRFILKHLSIGENSCSRGEPLLG